MEQEVTTWKKADSLLMHLKACLQPSNALHYQNVYEICLSSAAPCKAGKMIQSIWPYMDRKQKTSNRYELRVLKKKGLDQKGFQFHQQKQVAPLRKWIELDSMQIERLRELFCCHK